MFIVELINKSKKKKIIKYITEYTAINDAEIYLSQGFKVKVINTCFPSAKIKLRKRKTVWTKAELNNK
jgi:hypothetical protein